MKLKIKKERGKKLMKEKKSKITNGNLKQMLQYIFSNLNEQMKLIMENQALIVKLIKCPKEVKK